MATSRPRRIGPYLFGADDYLRDWINQRISSSGLKECSTIGVYRGDRLIAAAAYFDYRGPSVEIAFAADDARWATPDAVDLIARRYPFDQLGCRRLTAITREDNERAIRLMTGIGFQREGRIRQAFDDGSAGLLFGLIRDGSDE